jgi:hypothetical protein
LLPPGFSCPQNAAKIPVKCPPHFMRRCIAAFA